MSATIFIYLREILFQGYVFRKGLSVYLKGYKMRLAYIQTQTPLPNTVSDIWRLAYDHASRTIVMLNQLSDEDEVKNYKQNIVKTFCDGVKDVFSCYKLIIFSLPCTYLARVKGPVN